MVEEKKYRVESDLLGELKVPAEALYGVQTQRGINNYHISRKTMVDNPDFIIAIAFVKLAAIETNHSLGVSNNADYDFGDQISFFDVLQRVNAVTGIPYCQFLATNVVLDKTSEVKLLDIVSKYGFATVDGFLGHIEGEGDGVYAWVHTRKSSAKTLVSTQSFVNNNAEMIAEYSGDQAYKRSVQTYGGESSSFLTPGTTTTQATDGSVPPVDDSGSGGSGTDQGSGSGGSSSGGSDSGGDEEGGGYYE